MNISSLLSPELVDNETGDAQTNGSKQSAPHLPSTQQHTSRKSHQHPRKSYQQQAAVSATPQQTSTGLTQYQSVAGGVETYDRHSKLSTDHDRSSQQNHRTILREPTEASQHRPSIAHRPSSLLSDGSAHAHTSSNRPTATRHEPSKRPGLAANSDLRTLSNRSLASLTMEEGPTDMPTPRTFDSNDLTEEQLSLVNQLLAHLNEHPYAYDSYVQLINLLHSGFVAHLATIDDDDNAASYALLPELRQTREAMDSRFAVGEALWLGWLSDETRLARSSEERVEVVALLQRATQDEPASHKLWQMYIDWVEINWATCHAIDGMPQVSMSDDDKEICRAVFTQDMLHEVLEQAAKAVRWRVDTSHIIWNKYLNFMQEQANSNDRAAYVSLQAVEQLFISRLQDPHMNAERTTQLFWPIVSQLYGNDWETQMAQVNESMDVARRQMELRIVHEEKLQLAIDSADPVIITEEYNRYLKWENTHKQRAPFDKDIRSALFERALLQYPANAEWWIEYVDFLVSQQTSTHNPSSSVLPLLERATKHCPWSGELWARRILRMDYERRPHKEIDAMKHRATSSGLLDIGGMEDYLKVLVEWCSYLRRHAFSATAKEEDEDTAEVGITSALEDMQQTGRKAYGDDFKGDPLFRLESVQIKFFSEARRIRDARAIWERLVPTKRGSSDFWLKYYNWEITIWIIDRMNDAERIETTENGPHLATAVVEQALSQQNLDWPEKVADMYMDHFQHHESIEKVQAATIIVWEFRKKIAQKRAKEAEAAAQQQAQYEILPQQQPVSEITETQKRKRSDEDEENDNAKKARTSDDAHTSAAEPKRAREHLSVTLSNLPAGTTEKDVRSFLRGCGAIVSIYIAPPNDMTTLATVEFEQQEDLEFVKSRNGRDLNGNEIRIDSGTQSTLYVANYPASYDEAAIRKLFTSYGEITSVRFPSLKFNNRRRFCYVQFASHQQAKSAEAAMDGKKVDSSHQLLAKISDPEAKKKRSGAQAEQREVFVKNIDNDTSEDEIKTFFAQYGKVESINLLRSPSNKRLGTGFVVFRTADEAKIATEQANGRPLQDRILHVELSKPKGGVAPSEHAAKQDIIVKHGDKASEERRDSDVSMASAPPLDTTTRKTTRERQVGLFNVSSTVSDARIVAEMEKHGRVVKVQLRREQEAAIVEFEELNAAFSVRVGLEFPSLGPKCRSGDTNRLFNNSNKKQASAMRPSNVSRPAQRGARRGGLGLKRGHGFASATTNGTEDATSKPARSNADFKAMFEQAKKTDDIA